MSEVVKKEYIVHWNYILYDFKTNFKIVETTYLDDDYFNQPVFDTVELAIDWINEQIQQQIKVFNIIGKGIPKEPYRDIDATDDEFGNEID